VISVLKRTLRFISALLLRGQTVNFKPYTQTIRDPERRLFNFSSANSSQSPPMNNAREVARAA
jgi:hypothetical protein